MALFPDVQFIRFCYEKRDSVMALPPTRIPYMDLTYCVSGEMHYVYEGETVVLQAEDAILFPQGSVRQRLATDKPALYCSFNVSYGADFPVLCKGVLRNSLRSDTVETLTSVKRCYTSLTDHKNEKCIALFWYLYHQLVETVGHNEHPHVKHIKRYISHHLTEPMTLGEIAAAVHLSPHYCCALFSEQAGMPLFDFIALQRIELAKSLMLTTESSLTDIAPQCGFGDYNYFSRTFKKVTGTTAHAYRRARREN